MANLIPYDMEGKTFTAVAGVAVSGASIYATGSYTNNVTSTDTYAPTKVLLTALGSGDAVAGVALYDRASGTNNEVAILRQGLVLARANATVTASQEVTAAHATADGLPVVGAARNTSSIGRALQTAASGEYCYILLNI